MSGLSGAEQIAIAEAWADYGGSAAPFFAAAVPNSLDQPIRDVLQVCNVPVVLYILHALSTQNM